MGTSGMTDVASALSCAGGECIRQEEYVQASANAGSAHPRRCGVSQEKAAVLREERGARSWHLHHGGRKDTEL